MVGDTEGTTEYLKTVKDITVKCRKASGDWFSPSQEKIKNAVEVSGLEPGTDYIFKAVIDGTNTITVKNEVSVKTEEALQIPNSGFEDWYTDSDTRWSAGTFGNFTHYFITLILKVLLIYGGIQTTNIPKHGLWHRYRQQPVRPLSM